MAEIPTILTIAGLVPQSPIQLRQQLLALVAATNPGYTADLPLSLIEDISSTDVGALTVIDQARVELINSISPRGANAFVLSQLGQMLGVQIGVPTDTSVLVVFTGTPGWAVADGFLVGDGSFQYAVQGGGIIGSDGLSDPLLAIATQSGTWAVPADTVVELITTVPSGVTLSVNNPQDGLPGADAETETSYRARVMQANLAASQGMSRMLKTQLSQVSGVQPRLISVLMRDGGGWMIIVGGGDPYDVAFTIWQALFDISTLVGSELIISDISAASPAVVETFLNHGYVAGTDIVISDADPNDYDGSYVVLAVVDEKSFTLGTRYAAQVAITASWSGGKITYEFTDPHGITVGSSISTDGFTPSGYNVTNAIVTDVPSTTTFKISTSDPGLNTVLGSLLAGVALFDSTGLPPWVIGGLLTPNERNVTVSIDDYPNTYPITYVDPPQQQVTMTVTWNTSSPNFVSPAAVSQAAAPALADYINSIYVGQPINEIEMEDAFQAAVSSVLPTSLLTRLVFSVSINGVGTPVVSGTKIINGDPQSYFFAVSSGISVVQG